MQINTPLTSVGILLDSKVDGCMHEWIGGWMDGGTGILIQMQMQEHQIVQKLVERTSMIIQQKVVVRGIS